MQLFIGELSRSHANCLKLHGENFVVEKVDITKASGST